MKSINRAHRMQKILGRGICLFCILLSLAHGEIISSLPLSPINPTHHDCNVLYLQYNSIFRELSKKNLECIDSPPEFGFYQNCHGHEEVTAWVQCSDIDIEECEVKIRQDKEVADCRAKAHDPSEDYSNKETALSNANKSYERARDMIQLIKNPESFLREKLSPYPKAMSQIFGPDGSKFDTDLAQEIYRYSNNQAKAGIQLTQNPIIRRIQSAALQHIAKEHKNTIHELNQLTEDINNFKSDKLNDDQNSTVKQTRQPIEDLCRILGTCN